MTWNEYQRRVNEFHQREWREWDRTRRIACEVYNSMNEKPVHYEKYISLPSDPTVSDEAQRTADSLAFYDQVMAQEAAKKEAA